MKTTGNKSCKRRRISPPWHYMIMSANVKHILRREMKKPAGVRDKDLVDECILTLSYLDEVREKLRSDKSTEGSRAKRSAILKRAIAYFCLVIMLLSKVVQAGALTWQPHIGNTSDGVSISYGFETPVEIEATILQSFLNELVLAVSGESEKDDNITNEPDNAQFVQFDSLDEAYEYSGTDFKLPESVGDDMQICSVKALCNEYEKVIQAVYINGEYTCKVDIYESQTVGDDYSAYDALLYGVENAREEEIAGIKCVFAERDKNLIAKFCVNKRIYTIETNCDHYTLSEIISLLCG